MSSPQYQVIDRGDVHKSCRNIEIIINLLNDYCTASNTLNGIHKKLFRAIKECAAVKGTPQAPANALQSTSALFESLADVDSKYQKIIDRECESISTELRKWFKRLAKDEKTHDDRVLAANDKIKAAGLAYEKTAKRKNAPSLALEEHTRYMNIINSIGPEISNEKYNHAAQTTQNHTTALLSIGACFTRVGDAQWARSCEKVRRLSGVVGAMGYWRAFCEGGRGEGGPADLPAVDDAEVSGGVRGTSPASTPQTQSEYDPSTVLSAGGPGFNTLTASFPAPPGQSRPYPHPGMGRRRKSSLAALGFDNEGDSRVAMIRDVYDSPTSSSASASIPQATELPRRPSVHVAELASRYDTTSPPPLNRTSTSNSNSTSAPTSPAPVAPSQSSESLGLNGNRTASPISIPPPPQSDEIAEEQEPDPASTIRAATRRKRITELELQALKFEEEAYVLRHSKPQSRPNNDSAKEGGGGMYRMPSYSASYTQVPSATSTSPWGGGREDRGKPQTPTQQVLPRKPRLSFSNNSSSSSSTSSNPTHPHDCNCVSCILHRSPTTQNQTQTQMRPPKPEKPKGWIRRLSMPLPPSRKTSNTNLQLQQEGGVGGRNMSYQGQGGYYSNSVDANARR